MADAPTPPQNPNGCPTNNRIFLQRSIAASIAASVLGARSKDSTAAAPTVQAKADEMNAMHEPGIQAFPAKTVGQGGNE